MITVLPIDTPVLGDRTYLAHDGQVALVVDPQRDYDRVLGIAQAAGVRFAHVFESHIHNDYVAAAPGTVFGKGAAVGTCGLGDLGLPKFRPRPTDCGLSPRPWPTPERRRSTEEGLDLGEAGQWRTDNSA